MSDFRVRVDRTACTGHGMCAVVLGERVALDEWGYPIVDATPLPAALEQVAKAAVSACPVRALRLSHS